MKWIKWEKLTVRKEDGGLNFRNLLGFNLAMLGNKGGNLFLTPMLWFRGFSKLNTFGQWFS